MPSPVDNWVDQTQKELQQNSWQQQYALPGWQGQLTRLPPEQEAQFLLWAHTNNVPLTDDYDMRGFWANHGQTQVNQNDGLPHYSDEWKTPLHQSFSGESRYADPSKPLPKWNELDQLISPSGKILFDERKR